MKNTVADLIVALQALPDQTQVVHMEGCDCYGAWDGEVSIIPMAAGPYLLLTRDHEG